MLFKLLALIVTKKMEYPTAANIKQFHSAHKIPSLSSTDAFQRPTLLVRQPHHLTAATIFLVSSDNLFRIFDQYTSIKCWLTFKSVKNYLWHPPKKLKAGCPMQTHQMSLLSSRPDRCPVRQLLGGCSGGDMDPAAPGWTCARVSLSSSLNSFNHFLK